MKTLTKLSTKKPVAKKGASVLTLTGPIGIQNIEATRDAFIEHYTANRAIRLDLSGVESVDLSFLELLCSSHRATVIEGTSFEFEGTIPECLLVAASTCGFVRHIGCALNPTASCLWVRIAEAIATKRAA